MQYFSLLLKVVCFLGLFSLLSCTNSNSSSIVIAVASSMQEATKELIKSFEEESGIRCDLIIGSSGKLTAQIVQGAPFDVFLSADTMYCRYLIDKDMASPIKRFQLTGSLVLLSPDHKVPLRLDQLSAIDFDFLTIANPETAPYGLAAKGALERLGLLQRLQGKIVYGESIGQVNQFIQTKAAQFGITSKSSLISYFDRDNISWLEIDPLLHNPIIHGGVVLNRVKSPNNGVGDFLNYLESPAASAIFSKFGYTAVDNN